MSRGKRPVFLNLFRIRFPITAILSILHRILGVFLILWIPVAIYLFDLSLKSKQGFDSMLLIINQPLFKMISIVLIWALAHHSFAGIRYLLIDLEFGTEKPVARLSAYLAIILSVIVTLIYAWSLFL